MDLFSRKFFQLAREQGLFDIDTPGDQLKTILLPPDATVHAQNFHSTWRRHVANCHMQLKPNNHLLQIRMQSNLYFSIFFSKNEQTFIVADTRIVKLNVQHHNIIIHEIDNILPDLTFAKYDLVKKLPIAMVGGQRVDLTVLTSPRNIPDTNIQISFLVEKKGVMIQLGACHKASFSSSFTLRLPIVKYKETHVNMWMQVSSIPLNIPLISWLRPQQMTIFENVLSQPTPYIFDFTPTCASPGDTIWIHGKCFNPETLRILIGQTHAIIFFASPSLIKCITPKLEPGEYDIFVCNVNIYASSSPRIQVARNNKPTI